MTEIPQEAIDQMAQENEEADTSAEAKDQTSETKTEDSEAKADEGTEAKVEQKSKTAKNIERLLRQRNEQTHLADEAQQALEAKEAEIAELKAQLDGGEISVDDKVEQLIEKKLTNLSKNQKMRAKLFDKFPEAKKLESELDTVLKQFPSMTDEAALHIVAPELVTQVQDKASKEGSLSTRTSSNLRKTPSTSSMSTSDLESELRRQVSSGELKV